MTSNTSQTNIATGGRVSSGVALTAGIELGHYRLLHKIGQGGFGITYLAQNTQTNERVVIKENLPTFYAYRNDYTLHVHPLDDETSPENYAHTLRRFVDEARTLARLNHPNIVRVLEAFEALGTAYYVMPYIEAKELHKVLPTEAVNEAWLLPILKSVLGALGYLHAQNLLHRDLKPGNILLQADGTPIIIDFGTARALQTERSATMVGTPGYTPIEQITPNGKRGPWTDIYALGATCYRLITGELPPQAVERLDDEDPYRPLAHRAELYGRFSATLLSSIDTALAVRAKNRWQSAQAWLEALAAPADTRSVPISVATVDTAAPSTPSKGSSLPLILTLLAVVLLGGGGYGVYAYLDAVEKARLQAEYEQAEAQRIAREKAERIKREEEARLAREEADRIKREEEARLAREEAERKAREEAACVEYIHAVMAVHTKASLPDADKIPTPPNDQVVQTLRELADKGNHEAEFVFSVLTTHGMSVPQNETKAMDYLRLAANAGEPHAQNVLGECYYQGKGVAKDEYEAAKWYRKSADQGHVIAQNNLGYCYDKGLGVSKDEYEAVEWYRKSADQGHAQAQHNLGWCYEKGFGVSKDAYEAVKWYRKAADQGHANACNNLGWCYQNGFGVSKDEYEAVKWYRKSAEQGNAIAQCNLGYCYEKGLGVSKDEYEAAKWYRKAAEQGFAIAQCNLGWCYESGFGVSKNMSEAVKWYRKAARQGNTNAQSNLKNLGKKW